MKTSELLLVCVAVLAGGCASIYPKTPQELRNSGTQSDAICLPESRPVIAERFRDHFKTCYSGSYVAKGGIVIGYAYVPLQSDIAWNTIEENIGTETRFAAGNEAGYYMEVRVSEPKEVTSSCKSLMQFSVLNSFWTGRFDTFREVAQGKPGNCRRDS